ncbi:MAG: SRPBCC family protein [Geminicoccaceae bacterium]
MLRTIVKYIALFVVVVLAIAYILPGKVRVERATVIDAAPDQVFKLVNSFENFNRWSPWYERDPDGDYRIEGPDHGVGARMIWASDKPDVGQGSQEIVESVPAKLVRTKLDFGDLGDANAFFQIEPRGDERTHLVWGFDTDLGLNPVSRYYGLMADRWIGPDYEYGLAKLKTLAEESAETATN